MIGKAAKVRRLAVDLGGGRQRRLHARQSGVHQLQRAVHVDVPVKEQVDFGGAAAGDGIHMVEARHDVDGFFERLGDRHQHLVDGRDAVVDADDDAREIGVGENRDREW